MYDGTITGMVILGLIAFVVIMVFYRRRDWYYRLFRIPFFFHELRDLDGEFYSCEHKLSSVKDDGWFNCGNGTYSIKGHAGYRFCGRLLVHHDKGHPQPRVFKSLADLSDEREGFEDVVWSAQFVRTMLESDAVKKLSELGGWSAVDQILLVAVVVVAVVAGVSAYFGYMGYDMLDDFMRYVAPSVAPSVDGGVVAPNVPDVPKVVVPSG